MIVSAGHTTTQYYTLQEVYEYLDWLNELPDPDILAELEHCRTDTLLWLFREVSVPNGQFHIAGLTKDILTKRGICQFA